MISETSGTLGFTPVHWSSNALSANSSTLAKNSFSSIPASCRDFGWFKFVFNSNTAFAKTSIVAAGAIVIHSVPPFYLAIGTPARIKPLPDHLKVPNRF